MVLNDFNNFGDVPWPLDCFKECLYWGSFLYFLFAS